MSISKEDLNIINQNFDKQIKKAVEAITKSSALEAVKTYDKQQKDKVKRTRLHNVGLLMDHYLELVEHYENSKYRASEIEEDIQEFGFDEIEIDDIIIHAIKRSKIRTKIMINQIETAVNLLELEMIRKGEAEKIEAVKMLYMDNRFKDYKFNKRIEIVSEAIPCHQNTIRNWNREILDKLSVKLFGVDGLKLEL